MTEGRFASVRRDEGWGSIGGIHMRHGVGLSNSIPQPLGISSSLPSESLPLPSGFSLV